MMELPRRGSSGAIVPATASAKQTHNESERDKQLEDHVQLTNDSFIIIVGCLRYIFQSIFRLKLWPASRFSSLPNQA